MSKEEFQNCPTNKDIADHFQEQLVQLRLEPRAEDRKELMEILNKHLSYPDDELTNFHRLANKLGLLDMEAEERTRIMGDSHNMKETKIFKMNNKVTLHSSRPASAAGFSCSPKTSASASAPPNTSRT